MARKIVAYTDGGSRGNPGPSALGVVLCDEHGGIVAEHAEFLGEGTNNEAEYRAILRALELAAARGAAEVAVFSDSELVVRQLTGVYRLREPRMKTLHAAVTAKARAFRRVTYDHVLRTHAMIRRTDGLVNRALDEAAGTSEIAEP
jgi:ribonuclease HI